MSIMLPVFYGEVSEATAAPPECWPDESGSGKPGPELNMGMTADAGKGRGKKRVLTEARKEQNRAAQRLFRQRQRERRHQQQKDTKKAPKLSKLCTHGTSQTWKASRGNFDTDETTSSGNLLSSTNGSSPSVLTDSDDIVDVPAIPDSLIADTLRAAMPDPTANALEFLPTTVFGACLHNALALGVDLRDLASCGPGGISPFYRPSQPSDDPATLFSCAMLSLTRKPPPHLLPTLTQILIPHHPSLDLIPLPHLRDQAIMLSASMPQVFNMWELKLDIYQRGGLVMLKRRMGSNGKMRSCQPWESSSWVAKPWFLRKWSMVVDGEREQLSQAVPLDNGAGELGFQ